jgi:ABC-type transporter Mla maintaining outer membrane lipid asymmetry ATPase subunit MlaF
MSRAEPGARADGEAQAGHRASAQGVALGYEPPPGHGDGRVWIPLGGSHRTAGLSDSQRKRLVGTVLELRSELDARLVLLGVDVDGLRSEGRNSLRERIAFLPADGGLLSNLNAWENMVLPVGFHHPERLGEIAASVNDLLNELGADPHALLEKLPEGMTLYEKKLTGYVRMVLERPELMLVEETRSGLDSSERAATARFSAVYLKSCPGGTFVQLDVAPER